MRISDWCSDVCSSGLVDLTRIDATALYAGILVDTKNFAVQTGVRTFDAAAYLRRSGADPSLIRFLFLMDYAATRARSEVLANAELVPGGVIIDRQSAVRERVCEDA